MAKITYNNWKAISYAKAWCGKESNSCGIYLSGGRKSDCAHFIAHCLAAGGIAIKNNDPNTYFCPAGLAVRNVDIVAYLNQLADQFENVKKIPLSDAIIGDIGFLKIERPRHAFMVCETWDPLNSPLTAPKTYAHSDSRCCEELNTVLRLWLSDAFRLEDG